MAAAGMFLLLGGYIALDIWAMTRRRVWFVVMVTGWACGLALFTLGLRGLLE
ncbi:hypothetical protein SEA_NECROPOLIS_66 [Mycobacterium phage Necropolis]|uniref:Uncharacterized protein n=1 Tax=Mycobacterium phage Shipwreck TaxID=1821727 RepID=A0A143FNP4_9CAUD|nr:hypothetical protein SEA_SHIPWRECK_71 [Mycobacterium phage Shipwreck]AMW63890.1 hypothetical protein SEA_SHIPWRECK_71 [Mycobacterium phage Shipwreck]QDH92947.1 hypothetical protein SEA_NECROPOLIS_66 [Mycobacterium phage Necropolis]